MGDPISVDYACERSRELISLQLDGELSELGETRLAAHLVGCTACREFAGRARATTQALRLAPLEQPNRPILLPQRRKGPVRAVQVGAVAAVLLVATAIGTFASPRSHARRPSAVIPAANAEQQELRIVRNLRLQQIKPMPVGLAGGVQ